MVYIKSKPEYTVLDRDFKPGPKNGRLSAKGPYYAAIEHVTKDALSQMWGGDVPMDKFKEGWASAPPVIPDDCPLPGKDVILSKTKVPVRDGTTVEIKIYKSPKVQPSAALIFRMHGGGWTVCSHGVEEAENLYFGALMNAVVVSVDYRMAPEFPFPYPINDSWDVLKWIILVGNSAGGNIVSKSPGFIPKMTTDLRIKARDEGLTGIVAQSLAFPLYPEPRCCYHRYTKDGILLDCYLGTNPKPEQKHSPLLHRLDDLKGLPPSLVQAAGLDPLRDEGIAYAGALKAAGNEVELNVYSRLPHCFYMMPGFKQTADYFTKTIAFVKKYADAEAG
ncbi:esterase/lipase/thioesterase [Xylariales sp. AK1849]|nr:esterase/lipase/thioesterase [Xylariales sp. AK1849]